MYHVEIFEKEIKTEDYVRDYVNVGEFIKYCMECPNYGTVWSCPPFDFDAESYWKNFSSLYLTARRIIFDGETDMDRGIEIMHEVKGDMSRQLYEMEAQNPGSVSLSAGSCSMCKKEGFAGCTRSEGKPCGHPELMRYSIEAIGGNVGLTVSKLMGIELEWVTEGKLPSYFVLVGGLLKK